MFEFITLYQNTPFTVALIVMLMISILEIVGLMMGAGMSSFIDNILPDVDIAVEGPEVQAPGVIGKFYAWIRVDEVPILIILVVFLFVFGILGLAVQGFLYSSFGFLMPVSIGWLPILLLALPFARMAGKGVAKILPADETTAISLEELVGRVAIITLGVSKRRHPAEARVRDEHSQVHYVMVEPEDDEASFQQTDEVILIRRENGIFYCIAKPIDL